MKTIARRYAMTVGLAGALALTAMNCSLAQTRAGADGALPSLSTAHPWTRRAPTRAGSTAAAGHDRALFPGIMAQTPHAL